MILLGFYLPSPYCLKFGSKKPGRLNWPGMTLYPQDRFSRWLLEVAGLSKVEIPRYLNVSGKSESHIFVDASENAYAACVFTRSVTNNGVQVHLIRAKTRVAPIKTISIPRLELPACSIGARLALSVRTALDLPHLKTTFWTDSMVALWWIKSREEWSIFVLNRVREINEVDSPTKIGGMSREF
ncbi:uncharacterized protein TNIN_269831 [Trichonephila inaurata madagascariensis]|uniref:Uncharacterized protein n=1 Tax=Trichonephila inaurata madagascariensis TaxID=2747483 RepID=A0A8X6X5Y3_9ARAC|nr:uncharacterized protein TNIN_269831 [Trichonephila inaurata madagascariensis]